VSESVPRARPPPLIREVTRHGRPVWYVRVGKGKRIRMHQPYGSPEFWRDYRLAIEGSQPPSAKGPAPGTLAWLLAKYVESAEWSDFSAATRKQRHAIYRAVAATAGQEPIRLIDRRTILEGRDRPHAANVFVKAMRGLFT
jgi:hypothetical protein